MKRQGSVGNIISAFCSLSLPGLGQLFQGRLLAALGFFTGCFGLLLAVLNWLFRISRDGKVSLSQVIVLGLPIVILWIWNVVDAGRWEPEVKSPWTEDDERGWAREESRGWDEEREQRIKNSVIVEVDGAGAHYSDLPLGNLGISLDVNENHKLRVIFPKLTPEADVEYIESWHDIQSVDIPVSENRDTQGRLNLKVAQVLALPVREHIQFVEPELLDLRKQRNKVNELLKLTTKSEIYVSRREIYERALFEIENLLGKAEELQRLYIRFVREILIGRRISGHDVSLLSDDIIAIDNLLKKARREYRNVKESSTAYASLLHTGQI